MKKLKATALVILAATIAATSLSGCGIIRRVLDPQPETVVQTVYVTQEPTTAQPTDTVKALLKKNGIID